MGRSQTPTAVRKSPGGIPAHKRHQAIVETMADVPADVEAWVDVSGLKMQLKDVQQIHDLLADADESQGDDWQLRILYQGSVRPYRVELVVLRAPLMIPPVKKVLEAPRPPPLGADRSSGRPTMSHCWHDSEHVSWVTCGRCFATETMALTYRDLMDPDRCKRGRLYVSAQTRNRPRPRPDRDWTPSDGLDLSPAGGEPLGLAR